MKKVITKNKNLYLIIAIVVLGMSTIGTTYAYWVAVAASPSSSVKTNSTSYSLSMSITPLYSDFKFIPMDDNDALKGLKNKCRDQYNRGACTAYQIKVYDYDKNTAFISGRINTKLDNISNLSYMVLEEQDEYNSDKCATIQDKNYCIAEGPVAILPEEDMSLGSKYNVENKTEKNFILLLWLSNLNESQNKYDLGDFNSTVIFSMGNGGEIKGSISAAISQDDGLEDSSQGGSA